MSYQQLDEEGQTFLLQLYRESHGDVTQQLSMYGIGEQIGLERAATSKLVETLIGWELVEIRTLSGGIGITAGAVEELETLGFGEEQATGSAPRLGDGPVLEEEARSALKNLIADLKQQTGSLQLAFDALSEWMADLKTVDAQLESPRPKTGILRACLESLREPTTRSGLQTLSGRIDSMLRR